MSPYTERRNERDQKHRLAVRAEDEKAVLYVSCSCGRRISVRRKEDRDLGISMADLIELFRIHVMEHEHGARMDGPVHHKNASLSERQ